jgi:hydrogenase nickel incorporation protein HypA/HybF
MHETTIAQRVLALAEEVRSEHHGSHVNAIRLSVGASAPVDDAALRFAFSSLSRGGAAEGAMLIIEHEPFHGTCDSCGRPVQAPQQLERCPYCNGVSVAWSSSAETDVVSVEIAVESTP